MILPFQLRSSQILLLLVTFGVVGVSGVMAQRLPSATERERKNKPVSSRREGRPKRPPTPAASKTPASIESNNFLYLGNRFREQEKWNAAEAAYKEAVKVWPANIEARLELGFLYLDRNKLEGAQQTYNELRPLNASYASTLLAEINRYKAALAH